jgi:type II secretory pathway component PulC
MTWLTFTVAAKKVLAWLKHHWQIPFLVTWTILTIVIARRNSEALIDALGAKQKAYRKEIALLKESHLNEILMRDELIIKYNKARKEIEEKFAEKERTLSEQEKQKVKEIIVEAKGNPNIVKEKFQELFDIDYTG